MIGICIPVLLSLTLAGGPIHARALNPHNRATNGKAGFSPGIYSQGQVTINGTYSCDLDTGTQVNLTDPGQDFKWDQISSVERYIEPGHGAQFHVIGIVDFASIGYSDLLGYSYSSENINGSNDSSNQIPAGTVVAAITNEGRYNKFRIDVYGYVLTITWLTYEKIYPVYLPVIMQNAP
jgi:hypothetical protein